jgi:hypothetical protein
LDVGVGMKYYQAAFNDGYGYGNVNFTDGGSSFVGEQLYPLKNYYRNVNQWAMLTQFQGTDVFNFEVVLKYQERIYRKLYWLFDADLNFIPDVGVNVMINPNYNTGLKINFEKNFEFAITVTNKHMNLQSYYQSISASELPFLSYSFRMNLDKIKLGTKYLRI